MRGLAVVMAVFFMAACGEREQVVEDKRTYQGKRDTKAWDNAPLEYGDAKWRKGDQASWEKQVKLRQLTQDEYGRMGR